MWTQIQNGWVYFPRWFSRVQDMANITNTLPEEIQALFHLAGLTMRSVAAPLEGDEDGVARVIMLNGRWIAHCPRGLTTLREWQQWLANVLPSVPT